MQLLLQSLKLYRLTASEQIPSPKQLSNQLILICIDNFENPEFTFAHVMSFMHFLG